MNKEKYLIEKEVEWTDSFFAFYFGLFCFGYLIFTNLIWTGTELNPIYLIIQNIAIALSWAFGVIKTCRQVKYHLKNDN